VTENFSSELRESLLDAVCNNNGECVVVSGSMEPAIPKGTKIKINPYTYGDKLSSGDVVVINVGERRVIHRVLWAKNFVLQTKGDANLYADKMVSVFDVYGIVPEYNSLKILTKTYVKSFLKRFKIIRKVAEIIRKIRG